MLLHYSHHHRHGCPTYTIVHHKRTCSVQARHHASGIEYRHRSGLAEVRECECDPTEAAGINFASYQLKQPQERTFRAKTGHTHCVVRDLSTGIASLCPYSKVCFYPSEFRLPEAQEIQF